MFNSFYTGQFSQIDRYKKSRQVNAAHALFNEKAACAMAAAGVRRVVSLDSIPHATNSISVIDIIAEALGSRE